MKKSMSILLTLIATTLSFNVKAADISNEQLSPMVLIELHADMAADWVLAERLLILDIEDDISNQDNFPNLADELIIQVSGFTQNRLAINTFSYSGKVAE